MTGCLQELFQGEGWRGCTGLEIQKEIIFQRLVIGMFSREALMSGSAPHLGVVGTEPTSGCS